WPGGKYEGRDLAPGKYTFKKKKREVISTKAEPIRTSANWLALEQDPFKPGITFATLQKTTYTKNPIARADWFTTYATLPPAYYKLIGLKQKKNAAGELVFLEKDFEDLFKADLKKA